MSMEVLNRDCLSQIFLNLDFIERVKLENVCRIWYSVLQRQSTFSDMMELNIANFLINNTTEYYQQESICFSPTVMGIVERCGGYVRDLTFGQRWLKISQPIVDCIAWNCHRLRVVDFGAVILNADLSPLLERVAHLLEEFSIEETSWLDIDHAAKVQMFFKKMYRLRRLNLHSAMFELSHLDELPGNLKFVDIGGARRFDAGVFARFLRNQKNLEELHVAPIPTVDGEVLTAMGQLPQLEKLTLGYCDQIEFLYNPLMGLTKLKEFKIQNLLGMNETTMRILLSSMASLELLSIKNCKNIRDYTALGLCSKLTSLEITDTMQFSDEDYLVLCTYGRLKTLSLVNCFNLTTRGVNIASTRCQLKELVVNKCARVNDEMMYMMASTQRELEAISLQGCFGITSKGVSALAWLRNVLLLREIDVSHNRNVDDTVVLSLHNALTMAHRRSSSKKYGFHDDGGCCDKMVARKLLMYIFDTNISAKVEHQVNDLITMC